MASLGGLIGFGLLLAANVLLAGIGTRFLRLAFDTRWGSGLAILAVVPLLLTATTLLLSGVFHLGINLQDADTAFVVTVAIPAAVGVTIDFVWVASPDAVARDLEN